MSGDDEIDQGQWLDPKEDIINAFRASKPDISIDRPCDDCGGSGRVNEDRCKGCRGKGRIWAKWRDNEKDPLSDVRFAQAQVRNILTYLHDTSIINDQNAYDGRTYEIWYEIFTANMTQGKKQLFGNLRGEAGDGLGEHGFLLLLKRLPEQYHRTIKASIFTFQNAHTRFIARRNARGYERAFQVLSEMMPKIREELEELAKKLEAEKNSLK